MQIKYTGTGSFYEYPVTGYNALWQPGQISEVTGTRLTQLLATDGFGDDEVGDDEFPVTSKKNPVTGGSIFSGVGLINGADYVLPAESLTATALREDVSYRGGARPRTYSGGYQSAEVGSGGCAWYGEWNVPTGVSRLGAEFKFSEGTGFNGVICLAPWLGSVTAAAHTQPTPAHITISRYGWTVGKITAIDGVVSIIASGSFTTTLSANTQYTAEVIFDSGKAFLALPDGSTIIVSDAGFSTLGTYAGFEFYQVDGAIDDYVSIGRVWAATGDQMINKILGARAKTPTLTTTAVRLTSVAVSAIPTASTLLDPGMTCKVPKTVSGSRVLIRITAWITSLAGHSIILVPTFVDEISGTVVSQPAYYALTGAKDGLVSFETVQTITTANQCRCDLWYWSTGAGDTLVVAANKPITMSFQILP